MTPNRKNCCGRIDFTARGIPTDGLPFARFDSVIRAMTLDEVVPALQRVERACANGKYAMGFLTYEAAHAFDRALKTGPSSKLPLLFFGVATRPSALEPIKGEAGLGFFEPGWPEAYYRTRFNRIQEHIRAGDAYQVNLTFPMTGTFQGDPSACYEQLRRAQGPAYCGMLVTPEFSVLSLSPELFFERHGNRIETRPMKGTRKRGRTLDEDTAIAGHLRRPPTNMIMVKTAEILLSLCKRRGRCPCRPIRPNSRTGARQCG